MTSSRGDNEMLAPSRAAEDVWVSPVTPGMLKCILSSVRPRQWYKNVLLFVGIVFAGNLDDASMWATVMLAFVYFCLLSGAGYMINDVVDREQDRSHPTKSQRPIASGQLKVEHALIVAVLLIALVLAGAYLTINAEYTITSASYVLLLVLYSLLLKHVAIVDVLAISFGFVIRVTAGAVAIDIYPSSWLVICVFLLALFLALGKRRHELVVLGEGEVAPRASLSEYSPMHVDLLIAIVAATLIVSYLMYTFYSPYDHMLFTAPFVVYGVFRYLHLTHLRGIWAEPDRVFRDRAMLANFALWIAAALLIIIWNTESWVLK